MESVFLGQMVVINYVQIQRLGRLPSANPIEYVSNILFCNLLVEFPEKLSQNPIAIIN